VRARSVGSVAPTPALRHAERTPVQRPRVGFILPCVQRRRCRHGSASSLSLPSSPSLRFGRVRGASRVHANPRQRHAQRGRSRSSVATRSCGSVSWCGDALTSDDGLLARDGTRAGARAGRLRPLSPSRARPPSARAGACCAVCGACACGAVIGVDSRGVTRGRPRAQPSRSARSPRRRRRPPLNRALVVAQPGAGADRVLVVAGRRCAVLAWPSRRRWRCGGRSTGVERPWRARFATARGSLARSRVPCSLRDRLCVRTRGSRRDCGGR
jgi:hypothetical protein